MEGNDIITVVFGFILTLGFPIAAIVLYVFDIRQLNRKYKTPPSPEAPLFFEPTTNPLITLWYAPRRTVLHIAKLKIEAVSFIIVVVLGLSNALVLLVLQSRNEISSTLTSITGFGSVIMLTIFSALIFTFTLYGFGKLLGGKGSTREINIAVAWTSPPLILFNILVFVLLMGNAKSVSNSQLLLSEFIPMLWWIILLSGGLATAHQLSKIKALVTVLLTLAVYTVIIWAIFAISSGPTIPPASVHGLH